MGAVTLNTSCLGETQGTASWQELLGETVFKQDGKGGASSAVIADDDFFTETLGMPSKIDINQQCGAAAGGLEELPNDCSELKNKTGGKNNLNAFRNAQLKAMQGYACHLLKTDAIQGEMSCLKTAIQSVEQNINQMKTAFTPVLQKAATDIGTMDSMIQDRQTQGEEITKRLQGNPETGEKGLLQIKADLEAMAKSLPMIAAQRKSAVEKMTNTKARLEVLVQQNKMSLAMDCFQKKPQAGMQCVKNGPLVSAQEYLLCRYEQSQMVGKGGKIVANSANKKRAESRKSSLESVLKSIASESPSMTDLPSGDQLKALETSSKTYPIKSPADVQRRFSGYLKNFSAQGGLPVDSFMQAELQKCYAQADREVNSQRTDPHSQISLLQNGLKAQEDELRAGMKGEIIDFAGKYTEAVKGNTGLDLQMNTNACLQGTAADQSSCIQALSNALNTVLTGNITETEKSKLTPAALALTGGKAPFFAFDQEMPAKNPALKYKISCRGVSGCATALQAAHKDVKGKLEATQKQKTDYQKNVNNSITTQAQTYGKQMSQVSGELRKRMEAISKAFGAAGLGGALKLEDRKVDMKEIQPDEKTGLYDVNDIDKLIYGNTSPALLTLDAAGFAEAEGKLSEKKTEMAKTLANLRDSYQNVEAKLNRCDTISMGERGEKACERVASVCSQSKNDPLATVASTFAMLEEEDKKAMKGLIQKSLQTSNAGKNAAAKLWGEENCAEAERLCTMAANEGDYKDFDIFMKNMNKGSGSKAGTLTEP